MYATPPAIHALPPKPVFDHFSQSNTSSPAPNPSRPVADALPSIPGFHYSFCIQLSINPPPRREDILFASDDADANWLHPEGCPPEQQVPRSLPFYRNIVHDLESLCKEIRDRQAGCQASVTVSDPLSSLQLRRPSNHSFETNRPKSDIVIGVWVGGPDGSAINNLKAMFLARCPVVLVILTLPPPPRPPLRES